MTIGGFVFNVSRVDRNNSFLFFRSVVDLIERLDFGKTFLGQNHGDGSGQGRFAVVNVADSTDVDMGLRSYKLFFCHNQKVYINK